MGPGWRTSIPGCGVDTPSHLYSFSFAPNTQWSRFFAKRPEVYSYLERLTQDFGVRKAIEFGVEVERADYEPATSTWTVRAEHPSGEIEAITSTVLVSAVGMVNRPSVPPDRGTRRLRRPDDAHR